MLEAQKMKTYTGWRTENSPAWLSVHEQSTMFWSELMVVDNRTMLMLLSASIFKGGKPCWLTSKELYQEASCYDSIISAEFSHILFTEMPIFF